MAAALRSLDPFHPTSGAIQCPRANVFMDGPGGTYSLDIVIYENYDQLLPGHMGSGLFKSIDPQGDAPLRRYPGMPHCCNTVYTPRDNPSQWSALTNLHCWLVLSGVRATDQRVVRSGHTIHCSSCNTSAPRVRHLGELAGDYACYHLAGDSSWFEQCPLV